MGSHHVATALIFIHVLNVFYKWRRRSSIFHLSYRTLLMLHVVQDVHIPSQVG